MRILNLFIKMGIGKCLEKIAGGACSLPTIPIVVAGAFVSTLIDSAISSYAISTVAKLNKRRKDSGRNSTPFPSYLTNLIKDQVDKLDGNIDSEFLNTLYRINKGVFKTVSDYTNAGASCISYAAQFAASVLGIVKLAEGNPIGHLYLTGAYTNALDGVIEGGRWISEKVHHWISTHQDLC